MSDTGQPAAQWLWIRHAPTHAEGFCGWTDAPAHIDLTTIAQLRAALPSWAATARIATSDLRRATETAAALFPNQPFDERPGLREQHFGDWEGQPYDALGAAHPFWEAPAEARAPGGESFADVLARVRSEISALSADPTPKVVIAHAGAIRAAIAVAAGLTATQALPFDIAPLSQTELLQWNETAWSVGGVNRRLD